MIHALALASQLGIGINYNWWKLTPVSHAQCSASGEPANEGVWFLPSYDNAAIRATVVKQLRVMRDSGFTTLRLLVFYYHTTDGSSADSFTSTNGSVTAADRAKLRRFVRDVAGAGYRRLEVVPSFQAENDLYCRTKAWGDCFDVSRTPENWRFIETVARTAIGAAGGMRLRFDLGNEAAPDPTMPAATLAHAKHYLQFVAGHFAREFGGDWTISAARSQGSPAGETSKRLGLLLDDLHDAGLVPPTLELHTYSGDGNDVAISLDEASALAAKVGAALVLGELRYHSAVQADAIARWLSQHPDARLADAIEWPEEDPSAACAVDPQPPYTPGPLGTIRG